MGSRAIRASPAAAAARWLACLVLLLSVGAAHPVLALDPRRAVTQYVHQVWQTAEGLPQNSVHALLQTRDGYLWLGTQEGLGRFDGVRFAVFDKRNTEHLRNNYVLSLFEDSQGNLWIGTNGGLNRFKDGRFALYTTKEGLSDNSVSSISEDREGALWFATARGLTRFKGGRFEAYTTKDGLSDDTVFSVHPDPGGGVWIGTRAGLNRFERGRFTVYTRNGGLAHEAISAIHRDRAGVLWIGSAGGLHRLQGGTHSVYTTRQGLSHNFVLSLHGDRDGNLWIGTSSGLNRLTDGVLTAFTLKEGLSSDVVRSLHEDREGSLWIGTDGGGLNRLKDGAVTTFTTTHGLSNDFVLAVHEDREGSLWIATAGGGVNRFRNGVFTRYGRKEGLSHDTASSFCEGRDGSLWIGTYGGGVNRRKNGVFTAYTTREGLSHDVVSAVHEDGEGRLWIATNRGLTRLSHGTFTVYTTKDGLSSDRAVSIHEDREGSLWIGTAGGGLNRWKDGTFTAYTTRTGYRILSMHGDAEGSLWIGTLGGGLNRLKKDGTVTIYTSKEGLFDDVVYQILEDAAGDLWMSCNRGVFRVARKELDDFAQGKIPSITSTAYGTADGMKNRECNGGSQPAGCRARDGRLWFPTVKGVVVIDPRHLRLNAVPPPVLIEQVLIDGRAVPPGTGPRFPPGARDLEFHYTGLSFLIPERVRFRYMLEGFDAQWADAGTRRTAYYTNVPPGPYRFRVVACNNDGVWNEKGASYAFSIAPRFRDTGWFYALGGALILVVGGAAHRVRVAQLRRRERRLAGLVEERTRELVESQGRLQQLTGDLEERVRLSAAALAEKERMATYGHLVGAVAHEIRNPIFALRSAIHVVGERLSAFPDLHGPLGTIEKVSERLAAVTNSLLEFGRPQRLTPTLMRPRRLLEEVASAYRSECPPVAPVLVIDCVEDLPEVRVDGHQMAQALLNLVHNARQHALGVTKIVVSAALQDPTAGSTGGRVSFTVRDDGRGIPEEHLPWVFEPFFTTEGGTGLGLAIVRRIVNEHGGTVQVASPPGQGAVFVISLPCHDLAAGAVQEVPA